MPNPQDQTAMTAAAAASDDANPTDPTTSAAADELVRDRLQELQSLQQQVGEYSMRIDELLASREDPDGVMTLTHLVLACNERISELRRQLPTMQTVDESRAAPYRGIQDIAVEQTSFKAARF